MTDIKALFKRSVDLLLGAGCNIQQAESIAGERCMAATLLAVAEAKGEDRMLAGIR